MMEFQIDLIEEGRVFPHYWEKCVGSCHASLALREDFRAHLLKARLECGFQYLRFHGLLNDDMSVCKSDFMTNQVSYSFLNIDRIFDYLLEIGMKPFIELGFMPSAFASSDKTCFHYKGNITMPKDMNQWKNLIGALARHLVDRYGLGEVSTWFFEVWNEPNLRYFFDGSQEDYFKLYKATAEAIKEVAPELRVGGPATSENAWVNEMVSFCEETKTPLDFISTHHYPSDDLFALREGKNKSKNSPVEELQKLEATGKLTEEKKMALFAKLQKKHYERGILTEMTKIVTEQAKGLPVYYTEWNGSEMYDSAYQAAFVAKTLADNEDLVEGYSYWTFSDIFEELGQKPEPFSNSFGMLTVHGIEKPVYHLFKELHNAGHERLQVKGSHETVEILVLKNMNEYTVIVSNGTIPGGEIAEESVTIAFNSEVDVVLMGRLDSKHANPLQCWEEMGKPTYLTSTQITEIREAAKMSYKVVKNVEQKKRLTFNMEPQSVVILKVR